MFETTEASWGIRETWVQKHKIIDRPLECKAAKGPEPEQKKSSALSIFDALEEHPSIDKDDPIPVQSSKSFESFGRGAKKKYEHDSDKQQPEHKKCIQCCRPVCRLPISKLERKMTVAVQMFCNVDKGNQSKGNNKDGFKQDLLDGMWFLALHGKPCQKKIRGDSVLEENAAAQETLLFLHIAFVWGGLRFFYPCVNVCDVFLNDGSDEKATGWPLPSHVFVKAQCTFLDYYEWLGLMDLDSQWSVQVFELIGTEQPCADFCAASVQAQKHSQLPEHIVWHGPSDYSSFSRGGPGDQPGRKDAILCKLMDLRLGTAFSDVLCPPASELGPGCLTV